jgi:hypothetical protein
MALEWSLLGPIPNIPAAVNAGYEVGKHQRDQRSLQQARSAFAADPNNAKARSALAGLAPAELGSFEDQAYQRSERERVGKFRSAFGDYLKERGSGMAGGPSAFAGPSSVAAPAVSAIDTGAREPGPSPEVIPQMTMAEMMAREDNLTPPVGMPISRGPAAPDAASVRPPKGAEAAWERMVAADPAKAMEVRSTWAKYSGEQLKQINDFADQALEIVSSAHDQRSYEVAVSNARTLFDRYGMDQGFIDQFPEQYDPEHLQDLRINAMDTKDLAAALRQERRLDWDISDDKADNARADSEAGSRAEYRRQQASAARDRANRPGRGGRATTPRPPTKAIVVGRLLDKKARGETLSAAEQQVLSESGGADERRGLPEGTVIEKPDGTFQTKKNGRWVATDG